MPLSPKLSHLPFLKALLDELTVECLPFLQRDCLITLLRFPHSLNKMPYKISMITMKKKSHNNLLSVYHVKYSAGYFTRIISFKPHSGPPL